MVFRNHSGELRTIAVVTMLGFLLPLQAGADGLADLRHVLQKMSASSPLSATVQLELDQHTRAGGEPLVEKAVIEFEITQTTEGLDVRYPKALSRRVREEQLAHQKNPDLPEPIRNSINSVQAMEIADCIDFAEMLLKETESAQLLEDRPGSVDGKPSRLLVLKIPPHLSSFQKKHVKSLEVKMSIWLSDDGLPLVVDRSSQLRASFFLVGVDNLHKENWRVVRNGDRLIARRHEEEASASGLGQNFSRKTILTITPR